MKTETIQPALFRQFNCTEVSAVWCPVHGDCTCRPTLRLNDPKCALHASDSLHGDL